MYRKIYIILFVCCLHPALRLQAQTEEETAAPRYAVSIEPFYLYNGGLRLNLEKNLKANHWIELNLTGYWLPHSDARQKTVDENGKTSYTSSGYIISNSDFRRIYGLSGLGIGCTYKYNLSKYFTLNPAISYTRYNVENTAYDYVPYREDGLTFYEYALIYKKQTFRKLTTQITLSGRSSFKYLLFMEYYTGLGYAYSFYDENKPHFDETMFGYGYRGYYFTLGIKIGVNLR